MEHERLHAAYCTQAGQADQCGTLVLMQSPGHKCEYATAAWLGSKTATSVGPPSHLQR